MIYTISLKENKIEKKDEIFTLKWHNLMNLQI